MPDYVSRLGRGVGLAGALLISLMLAVGGSAAPAAAAGAPPLAGPAHVAFLGDSYTFGVGATQPTDSYAYLVARDEHWGSRVVGLPGSGYVRVAISDLSSLRAAPPDATLVLVGPTWLNGYPDRKGLYVRRAIHAAQRRVAGTLWIDPIARRWFTGSWTRRTGDDATMINYAAGHPNNLGHHHIASLLESDLRSLGVR